ncbi:MAG: DUF1232 domain-containing protein [Methanofastidiosum sp.]
MEWYYIVLLAVLGFFAITAVVVYKFRERLFNWVMTTILGIYIASPLDLLPDFIPVAGWADDIAAFVLMIGFIFRGVKMLSKKNNGKEKKATQVKQTKGE